VATASEHVTAASAFFMNELVKMEPGTENSGIYANKPGYHNSRAGNIALDKVDNSSVPDYSIRLPLDLQGPSNKAAAYDWTHEKAHSGNYASMAKYGDRLEAAFNAKDPRLAGWREALGQTDTDATPEGLDFVTWTKRTPDSTHAWHWHFSELRAFVESMINKLCMLSVLKGQTLAAYLAGGGQLLGGTVATADLNLTQLLGASYPTGYLKRSLGHVYMDLQNLRNGLMAMPGATRPDVDGGPWIPAGSTLDVMVKAAQKTLAASGSVPVAMTPEDMEAIASRAAELVVEKLGDLRFTPSSNV
jgi:hypothetical protein